MTGYKVTLAGQDISSYTDELNNATIDDTLGQGPGKMGGTSGRASTCTLDVMLGPAASAIGSGQTPSGSPPQLVRQGELLVYDASNTLVYGGYVSGMKDKTAKTTVKTELDATDYWQDLSRINVTSETFDGVSDTYVINSLLATYAPNIGRSLLPTTGSVTIYARVFRNINLQAAIQQIADISGYLCWVDYSKNFHYVNPTAASSAPFSLSDHPDFHNTFTCNVTEFDIDDTAIINRVTFYGGKRLSNDFWQDISTQANGNNTTFMLAYYPHKSSDGKFHIKVNGVEYTLGYYGSTGAANQLISQGGSAYALINTDGHAVIFSSPPAAGSTVLALYQYEVPLVIQIVDKSSLSYFGRYFDGTISDTTVYDPTTAVIRCKTLLSEQSMGLKTLKITCWKAGIQAGQLLRVDHTVRGIHETFLVQEVQTKPLGNGFFQYDITAGAWGWNVVDLIMGTVAAATPADTTSDTTSLAVVQSQSDGVAVDFTVVTHTNQQGMYYPEATPVGDGTDAYPGLCSI